MRIRFSAATAVFLALAAFTFQSVSAAPEPQGRSVPAVKQTAKARTAQKQISKKASKKTAEKSAVRKAKSSSKVASRGSSADKTAIEARRAETQNRIEEVRSSISQKSSVKKKLEAEMKQSEVKIRQVRQSLQKLRRERAKSERTLKSQEKTVIGLENELSHEQKILEEINQQRLELLTQQQQPQWAASDPNQKARTHMMLSLLAKKSTESIQRLEKNQKELGRALQRSKRTSDLLQKTLQEERSEQTRLTKERRDRQLTAAKLNRELASQTMTLKRLQNDEKRLGNLVASLQRKEAEKAAQRRAAAAAKRSGKQTKTASAPAPRKSLAASGARMNPVPGKVVARFGEKRTVSGKTDRWQGTVFSVTRDEGVHAVRDGKVVFADYLRGYGNLIILDHGAGYFTVYGNNATLEKDIGDRVKVGDVISRAGKNEGAVSVLYFELRHNGKPIDPTGWLNI
ncbi:murein hydrolase activator EnvC [uncultured Parasutterella sp.]|uniref:murein hydrolase activator EnvC family protein n=1 Tax=uncultured Parasutterella sp. TaxID=1263098 RepID=UPI00261E4D9C|nr:peptidoglycan DD-metalloendopeptidase family protein [uncultured Parasutterella sp.]